MNEATRRTIQEIDTAFYHERAAEFAAKRTHPWPGWRTVVDEASMRLPRRRPAAILDLGCGHGRFARLLADHWPGAYDYLGIDTSGPLLEMARDAPGSPTDRFVEADILEADTWRSSIDRRLGGFDLIVAFGVMHHIPGATRRHHLLRHCRNQLTPGGLLALSFWQFSDDARSDRKLVAWENFPQVDRTDLEPGDHLMIWGGTVDPRDAVRRHSVRYCHLTSPREADALVASADLAVRTTFRADGRSAATNYYVLAEAAPGADR